MAPPVINTPNVFWLNSDFNSTITGIASQGTVGQNSYTSSNRRLVIRQSGTTDAAIDRWVEFELPAPVDLTNSVCVTCISRGGGSSGFDFIRFGLRSGATPNTNCSDWDIDVNGSSNQGNANYVDPATPPDASIGTLDLSDVRAVRYSYNLNASNFDFRLFSSPCYFDKDIGVQGRLGEDGNPIDVDWLARYFLRTDSGNDPNDQNYFATSSNLDVASGTSQYYQVAHSVTFGSGSVNDFINIESAAIIFSEPDDHLLVTPRRCNINAGLARTYASLSVLGSSLGDSFFELSSVANSYTEFFSRALATLDLGISNFVGTLRGITGLVSNGGNLRLTFEAGTAPTIYSWNGTANLSGSVFSSPCDYAIDFGSTFTTGATFDATDLTFTIEPSIKKFILNAPGKTLNLSVGSSDITAADVEVIAGSTLNIVAPQLTLTITDLPVGSELRIYDLDNPGPGQLGTELAGIEEITGTTFAYPGIVQGNTVWIQVIADGFVEFGQSFTMGSASQAFPVQMRTEENI